MDKWAELEMKGVDFNDQRLNKRAVILLESLGSKPSLSIPASCKGLKETLAAYRFYDNTKVTWEKVLSPHRDCTIERIKKETEVLCIQDTTELHFPGGASVVGLGPLNHEKQRGLHLHPTLAVTPDRVPLGILDAWFWARDDDGFGEEKNKFRHIEEKESIRWLEGYQRVNELAAQVGETRLTYVGDREADIYEIFAEHYRQRKADKPCADLLIRVAQKTRKLTDEGNLLKEVERQIPLGSVEFDYPGSSKQPARRVQQSIRVAEVKLKAPRRVDNQLPDVTVTIVLAREENPPDGCEAMEWILLSTRPARTLEEAAELVRRYCCRWNIELFFKVLKSGCQVEKLQLEHIDRLEPALALYMIIAWRVLFLTFVGRVCPDLPCDVVFDSQEWRAVYLVTHKAAPPLQPPSLSEMVCMLAMLGGFLNRKGDGPPGSKTLWIGLQRMRDFVLALEAHDSVHQSDNRRVASG